MKHLLACLAILAGFNVTAQVDGFQLPYNPDSEPDGYIGVGDVLEVLSIFGSQWNASDIYMSNDNSSMTMYVGEMNYHNCLAACSQLGGDWRLSTFKDFAHILDTLGLEQSQTLWLNDLSAEKGGTEPKYLVWQTGAGSYPQTYTTNGFASNYGCYCSTHERPKVEQDCCYSYSGQGTSQSLSELNTCINQKLADGWMLYSGPGVSPVQSGATYQCVWRFAD